MIPLIPLMLVLSLSPAPPSPAQEPTSQAEETRDPALEVEETAKKGVEEILEILKDPGRDRSKLTEGALRLMDTLIAFDLLGKLVLGPSHWKSLEAEQQQRYRELFRDLLRYSMLEKLQLFTDETVEFGKAEEVPGRGSPKYRITLWVVSKGERTELELLFVEREGNWMVFDWSIEGVSVLKIYGSQYRDHLKRHPMDDLLRSMEGKLEESKRRLDPDASGSEPDSQDD